MSRSNAGSVFRWVIDDVVAKMKAELSQEGVDESVLDELRHKWETRLVEEGMTQGGADGTRLPGHRVMSHAPPAETSAQGLSHPQPGAGPSAAMPEHIPPEIAQQMLMQHMQQVQGRAGGPVVGIKRQEPDGGHEIIQIDGAADAMPQHDGPADDGAAGTSGGGEAGKAKGKGKGKAKAAAGDKDGEGAAGGGGGKKKGKGKKKEEDAGPSEPAGPKAPPVGDEVLSDDSAPEEEDDGDVSNYLCCQFEKVHRVKNKWKINVRDGVFRVDGQDYLFKKGTGEWSWT